MTAFAAAIDTLFADPSLATDAVYTPNNGGDPLIVRVIARRPDTVAGFGDTRIHATTALFEVRVSDVAAPAAGDTLAIPGSSSGTGETYVVQGEPTKDRDGLIWTLDTRPA